MKDTHDRDTYIQIGKRLDYRLVTVSGEHYYGFKQEFRVPTSLQLVSEGGENKTCIYRNFIAHQNSVQL